MPVPIGLLPALGLGAGLSSIPLIGRSMSGSGSTRSRTDNSSRGPTISATSPSGKPRSRFNQDLRWLGGLLAAPFNPTVDAFSEYFRATKPTGGGVGPDIQEDPRSYGPGPAGGGGGAVDWASILAALEGQRPSGGGVGVNRSLFQLSETPEEAAMLASEIADIEARRAAGDIALREGWGKVRAVNVAAADKARSMVVQVGEDGAAVWSQAAQQALDLAEQRAEAAGQFEGRAGIDVDPTGGAADFVGFMESQAPAERRFAERQQEILGSDLDWMAGMAESQGEAYAGDLRRQSNVLSFERAREHNMRVQDRTSGERMMLAQMEMQAQATNAQLAAQAGQFDPFAQLNNMVGAAAVMGNPGLLAQQLNITPAQAQQMIDNFLRGTQATVQAATPVRP